MLSLDRIPLNAAEHDAIEALLANAGDSPVSLTRRDPGENGPVLVHVAEQTYEVDEHGDVTDTAS